MEELLLIIVGLEQVTQGEEQLGQMVELAVAVPLFTHLLLQVI